MGKTADWNEIAKDCIAFANATGGRLLLGLEDGEDAPPAGQEIPAELPDTIRRKLAERTANLVVLPDIVTAQNGGQYIEFRISRVLSVVSIHQRIGGEIHPNQVKRVLEALIERGAVCFEGNNRWRRCWAVT